MQFIDKRLEETLNQYLPHLLVSNYYKKTMLLFFCLEIRTKTKQNPILKILKQINFFWWRPSCIQHSSFSWQKECITLRGAEFAFAFFDPRNACRTTLQLFTASRLIVSICKRPQSRNKLSFELF
jgi:hypothetical protein